MSNSSLYNQVRLNFPNNFLRSNNILRVLNDRDGQTILRDGVAAEPSDAKNLLNMHSIARQFGQQVNLHSDSVSLTGHDLQSQSVHHGSAPARDMVQSHSYAGNISASFFLDSHLRERHFFEMWMKMAVNIYTHKANYYDDYIGDLYFCAIAAHQEPPTWTLDPEKYYSVKYF